MGGMAIVKSETLDVLGTSIRSDLRWDDHVFNVSKEAFWSGVRNASLLPIYALSMLPTLDRKWNTIHTYGQVRQKAHLILENARPDSLNEYHRPGIRKKTRLSGRSHAFTVATMSQRTTHCRENLFFTRTTRFWNDLSANIYIYAVLSTWNARFAPNLILRLAY